MRRIVFTSAILSMALIVPAIAQDTGVPANWAGCDSTCRAKRDNPKPELVSPEVDASGRVTVRIFAPEAKELKITVYPAKAVPMTKSEGGVWTYTSEPMKPGYYSYQIEADKMDALDPNNLWMTAGRTRFENMVEVGGGEDFARNDPAIAHGAVAEVYYRSPGVEFERRMHVYTPPGYGLKPETLPVLYLLHGGNQSDDNWPKLGRAGFILDRLIADGKAKRMIVVMPDGYVADARRPSGAAPEPFTDDLLKGVIPYVEANYTVSKEPKDRAIAGLSRGAAQTFSIFRDNPETFDYVGVFSFSRSRVTPLSEEAAGLTADGWSQWRDTLGKAKVVYWTVGDKDAGYPASQKTWDLMKANNVVIEHELRPGDHEWSVWRAGLRDFAQKIF